MVVLLLPAFSASPVAAVGQIITSVVAIIATVVFVGLAARLAWVPIFRKAGLWGSSALLVFMLVAVGLAAAVVAVKLGGRGFVAKLCTNAAFAGLLFSWCHAAICCAEARPNA